VRHRGDDQLTIIFKSDETAIKKMIDAGRLRSTKLRARVLFTSALVTDKERRKTLSVCSSNMIRFNVIASVT
jgi:hypothetical protein